jgi:hypothetical protein
MSKPAASFREKLDKFKGRRFQRNVSTPLGVVTYRSFTEDEWGEVEAAAKDRKLAKRTAIIHSLCDPTTEQPLFTDADMEYLGGIDSAVIDRLAEPALKMKDLTDEAMAAMLGEPAAS